MVAGAGEVKTRFTYMDGFVFEFVDDGEYREYNVLVSPDVSSTLPVSQTGNTPIDETALVTESVSNVVQEQPILAPPLLLAEQVVVPTVTKKKRTLMGMIRGAWFIIFTFAGEAVQYGLDNLTGLNLPPKTGMLVGASLYAAKRAIWPDSVI